MTSTAADFVCLVGPAPLSVGPPTLGMTSTCSHEHSNFKNRECVDLYLVRGEGDIPRADQHPSLISEQRPVLDTGYVIVATYRDLGYDWSEDDSNIDENLTLRFTPPLVYAELAYVFDKRCGGEGLNLQYSASSDEDDNSPSLRLQSSINKNITQTKTKLKSVLSNIAGNWTNLKETKADLPPSIPHPPQFGDVYDDEGDNASNNNNNNNNNINSNEPAVFVSTSGPPPHSDPSKHYILCPSNSITSIIDDWDTAQGKNTTVVLPRAREDSYTSVWSTQAPTPLPSNSIYDAEVRSLAPTPTLILRRQDRSNPMSFLAHEQHDELPFDDLKVVKMMEGVAIDCTSVGENSERGYVHKLETHPAMGVNSKFCELQQTTPILLLKHNKPRGICDVRKMNAQHNQTTILHSTSSKKSPYPLPSTELNLICYPQGVSYLFDKVVCSSPAQFFAFSLQTMKGETIYVHCLKFWEGVRDANIVELAKEKLRIGFGGSVKESTVEDIFRASALLCDESGKSNESHKKKMNGGIARAETTIHYDKDRVLYRSFAICIVSSHAFVATFRGYLSTIIDFSQAGALTSAEVGRILSQHFKRLTETPIPFHSRFLQLCPPLNSRPSYYVPVNHTTDLPHCDVFPSNILNTLPPEQLLILVVSVLSREEKLILASKNTNLILESILFLQCLLFPFKWTHPCIPYLTEAFESVLEFPAGILVGIVDDGSAFYKRSVLCEDAAVVFLDEGTISPEDLLRNSWSGLPQGEATQLLRRLRHLRAEFDLDPSNRMTAYSDPFDVFYLLEGEQDGRGCAADYQAPRNEVDTLMAVRLAFLSFYRAVLKDYQLYLLVSNTDASINARNLKFAADEFLQSHRDTDSLTYLSALVKTQLFEDFIRRRLDSKTAAEHLDGLDFFDTEIDESKHGGVDIDADLHGSFEQEHLEESSEESQRTTTVICDDGPGIVQDWSYGGGVVTSFPTPEQLMSVGLNDEFGDCNGDDKEYSSDAGKNDEEQPNRFLVRSTLEINASKIDLASCFKSNCLHQVPKFFASTSYSIFFLCLPFLSDARIMSSIIVHTLGKLSGKLFLDEATYRAIFLAAGKAKMKQRGIVEIFRRMRTSGILPNATTMGLYSKVIAESVEDEAEAELRVVESYDESVESTARQLQQRRWGRRRKFRMWSRCAQCSSCGHVFLDEELMSRCWGEPNNAVGVEGGEYDVGCPRCKQRVLVEMRLGVREEEEEEEEEKVNLKDCKVDGDGAIGGKGEGNGVDDGVDDSGNSDDVGEGESQALPPQLSSTLEPLSLSSTEFFIPQLSPPTLRLSLERIIAGGGSLYRESMMKENKIVFFNLCWLMERLGLSLPLQGGSGVVVTDEEEEEYGEWDLSIGWTKSLAAFDSWSHPLTSRILCSLVASLDSHSLSPPLTELQTFSQTIDPYTTLLYLISRHCKGTFPEAWGTEVEPCEGKHFWCKMENLSGFDREYAKAMEGGGGGGGGV